jgi:hypothetical protein
MPTKKQTLIFSIAHSYDLMFFYRLVMESNYKEKYIIKILFQEHKYFKGKMPIVNRMLLAISDKIVFVKNDQIPRHSINLFKHVFLAYKMKRLIRYNFNKKDRLLILDKSSYSSNILLSYFNRSVLFQFQNKKSSSYELYILKNILIYIYHAVINIPKIKVLKLINSEKIIEEFIVDLKNIDKVFIANDKGPRSINFSIVDNTIKSNKIVIFGSRYNQWNLKSSTLTKINTYYENIYNTFKDKYLFVYIEHPLEKGSELKEMQEVFDNSLLIETRYLNSEHYLIENKDTAYCFSIGSTSSKSAYQMGFNSKVGYKWILSDTNIILGFDSVFDDIADDIHMFSPADDISNSALASHQSTKLDVLDEIIKNQVKI